MSETSDHSNGREQHLRNMLIDAHQQLAERDQQLLRLIQGQHAGPAHQSVADHIRHAVEQSVPAGSTVLVISKGDDALLDLGGYSARHFPQSESGGYAGYYPADSREAVAHLESLKNRGHGVDCLVIPAAAFWWFEHYADFHLHLETNHRLIWLDGNCAIYSLKSRARADSMVLRPRPAAIMPGLPFGLNVAGNFCSEKGTGEAVRSNIRSLTAAGIRFVLNYVPDESSSNEAESAGYPFSNDNPFAVNLIHLNPDSVPGFLDDFGEQYLSGRYNIGYWVWELSDFPKKWASLCRFFHEIWVPSDFVLDAISRVSPIPVVKIPHALREPPPQLPVNRARFGIAPRAFCFFFMFDFHSFMERKNPLGLIKAFASAFDKSTDVQLVLKCSRSTPDDLATMRHAGAGANVHLFDKLLDRAELTALMNCCDCYISLHRSEGFGLTMAEAMNLGKPVIATGYSGNMDFMSLANSYPVKFSPVKLSVDHGDYARGSTWAEPDLSHAAEMMRQVYEHQNQARQIALLGQKEVREKLSPAAVGRLMSDRLQSIARFAAVIRDRLNTIAATAQSLIPPHVRVAVVAGGDERLLNLGPGQRGIHFPHRQNWSWTDIEKLDAPQLIAHLEISRQLGTGYLFVPRESFTAVDRLSAFASHLRSSHRAITQSQQGRIYQLLPSVEKKVVRERQIKSDPSNSHGMRLARGRWTSDGAGCNVTFTLESPTFVSAVRIVCSYVPPTRESVHAALMRVFWGLEGEREFNEDWCVNMKQYLATRRQNRLVVVNEKIDQIRFDPDIHPATLDELEIFVLVPAYDHQENPQEAMQ